MLTLLTGLNNVAFTLSLFALLVGERGVEAEGPFALLEEVLEGAGMAGEAATGGVGLPAGGDPLPRLPLKGGMG